MRASVTFTMLLLFVSACSYLQHVQQNAATIEFERQEDNGSVNILPCTLVVSDHQRVTLIGGQHATVSVSPGKVWIEAFSPDPYSPHFSAKAWRSTRISFQVGRGERVRFSVEPEAAGSTYIGGWFIRAPNTAPEPTDSAVSAFRWSRRLITSSFAGGSAFYIRQL